MDIVDELKEQGQALNEASMYGDGGELLFRAAEEIVKLRAGRESDEKNCEAGFQQAYEIIVSMRNHTQKVLAMEQARLDAEYRKALEALKESCHEAGCCGQSVFCGQGVDPQTGLPLSEKIRI